MDKIWAKAYVGAAILALTGAEPSRAACLARFDGTNSTLLTAYDPFAPTDLVMQKTVRLMNLSGENCRYRIYFQRAGGDGRFSDQLQYSLLTRSGQSLLTEQAGGTAVRYVSSSTVSENGDFSVDYLASIGRGQIAGPGRYTDRVETVLYTEDGLSELDRRDLWIGLPVESVAMLSIAGGGVATSVPFGKLTTGATRTVIVEARANAPYTVELISANDGRMLLDPPVAGQVWSIAYRVTLDGAAMNLETEQRVPISSGSAGVRSHTLGFQILEIRGKRAGNYRDVITAKISIQY